MIRKLIITAALMALPVLTAEPAQAASEYCREYTKTVSINGRAERAYGTACRRSDGSWEVVNLEGNPAAQEKVHDSIYEDIEKEARQRRHSNVKIIVVDRYAERGYIRGYKYAHNKSRYFGKSRYYKVQHSPYYYSHRSSGISPFSIHVDLGGNKYKSQSYNSHRGKSHYASAGHRKGYSNGYTKDYKRRH